MIPNVYRNAYKEVYTILTYLVEEDYNKIPPKIINAIKDNMNDDYEYYMNDDVDLFNQPMLPETKATLYNLFRDYLATPEQREKIKKWQQEDRIKAEIKKQEEYEYKELFSKGNVKDKKLNDVEDNNKELVEYKESLFDRIKNWFKKLFR